MKRTRGPRFALSAIFALLALAPSGASAATIPVTTTSDTLLNGMDCSLREAIRSVNQGSNADSCVATGAAYGTSDTINLPAGTYTLTIDGEDENSNNTGDLDITSSVSIVGSGNPEINQAFATFDRILHVPTASASLSLSGLSVQDGVAAGSTPRGGNIYFEGANGRLTLTSVEVSNGLANAAGGAGGGIAADDGSEVEITNGSSITDNRAGGAIGSAGSGGGIAMQGPGAELTVTQSQVTGNHAADDGGAGSLGIGGGIRFDDDGTGELTLTNTTIDGNFAGGGTSLGGSNGGGVAVTGNGVVTMTANGGSISGNTVGGGPSITNMNFSQGAGFGGGLYMKLNNTSSAQLTNVDLDTNQAGGNGGRASGQGGAIFTDEDLTVTGGSMDQNKAGRDDTGGNNGAPGLIGVGGAIRAGNQADLSITGTAFSQNITGENVSNGGAISMASDGNLTVSGASITNNTAGNSGAGGGGIGGGILRIGNIEAISDTISDTTISGNQVNGIGGAAPTEITQGGAGLFSQSRGSMTIQRSTIADNQSLGTLSAGAGLSLDSVAADPGSYLVLNSTINNNTLAGNQSRGGGVATGARFGDVNPPVVDITHSTIAGNNVGAGSGGNLAAINTVGGSLTDIRGNIIANGTSSVAGATNCEEEVPGNIESQGENVESSTPTQCGLSAGVDDLIGVNPMLGALGLNAPGTTSTMAIPLASPAADSVQNSCPATDQRGVIRPQGSACDAGAFEIVQAPPPNTGGGVTIIDPPPQTISAPVMPPKKCKKGQKLKKGKCVKRKRKKKKK